MVVEGSIFKKALAALTVSVDSYMEKARAEEPHSWSEGYYRGISDGIRLAQLVIGFSSGAAKLAEDNLEDSLKEEW